MYTQLTKSGGKKLVQQLKKAKKHFSFFTFYRAFVNHKLLKIAFYQNSRVFHKQKQLNFLTREGKLGA